ncbi:phenylacetaldoxime dehydratase family protein [Amycolatopsis sp. OK19-0408]|uniref:Phenylacetaldoxime dehydratase family protein n=1 Tax=Amycolatopsis iheyensis TaxID=2945988 RepID=A0A9X2NDR6_9PSEU|nr:phenylacetaldoxime dehydratase family protein [Amycolatopsis iheyensis]MCR6485102.1 phenylacetaldoxime dehydratase family protein [Amycolatopsis iheyensis]
MEPVLRAGMDFLCDDGRSVGCSANRYLRVLGEDGQAVDKSFGMSWWRGLADLDRWVTVATADEQYFEYLGCHPGTGLLRAV